MNLFVYAKNNSINAIDPLGLEFFMVINEAGTKEGEQFGAQIILITDRGDRIECKGSSWPNNGSWYPGIKPGNYESVYRKTGNLRTRKPGIRLRDGNYVPANGANPGQILETYDEFDYLNLQLHRANGVVVHEAYSDTWRGSSNCPTVKKDCWQLMVNALKDGETGRVMLNRAK